MSAKPCRHEAPVRGCPRCARLQAIVDRFVARTRRAGLKGGYGVSITVGGQTVEIAPVPPAPPSEAKP